ncbi:NAD-dependent epimerase/dehydratase family protein [Hymenobacter rigui]|uniref:NAD-dependent epimerase/dehydratase family protein n=1 Tax=Hymenobacter rigui TaxID=334424 RepID=UPI00196A948A|nr:NAD-dependent epimerase/dehydratase family protein [Hymenobacter rigui]
MNQPLLVLAGGTGFLGRQLALHFRQLGYEVLTLTRRAKRFGEVAWDGRTLGPWAKMLEGAAALINLAGKSVDCRYHAVNRYAIVRSRTESTRVLGEAVAQCQNPPAVWLNSSTATIYEDTTGAAPANTEAAGRIGRGFSEMVAQQWEAEFNLAPVLPTRRVALRTAIVL